MNLGTMLHEMASQHLHETALVCRDRRLSHAQLDAESRGLARRLLAEGLKPGDRVGVHWSN